MAGGFLSSSRTGKAKNRPPFFFLHTLASTPLVFWGLLRGPFFSGSMLALPGPRGGGRHPPSGKRPPARNAPAPWSRGPGGTQPPLLRMADTLILRKRRYPAHLFGMCFPPQSPQTILGPMIPKLSGGHWPRRKEPWPLPWIEENWPRLRPRQFHGYTSPLQPAHHTEPPKLLARLVVELDHAQLTAGQPGRLQTGQLGRTGKARC